MLADVFSKVLNMSITASIAVLAVCLARFALRKAPKIYAYILWSLVLFRLLCPFSILSSFSLMPDRITSGQIVSNWEDDYIVATTQTYSENQPQFQIAVEAGREPQTAPDGHSYVLTGSDGISEPDTVENAIMPVLSGVWITGMIALSLHSLISYCRIRKQTRVAVLLDKNIYLADDVVTPFVMGVLRPAVYLPATLDEVERKYIIAHEQLHIRRGDPVFKALGFLALTIHWFNPVVWIAFVLAGRDMEMSCDEAVIQKLGVNIRADYSVSLLNLATGHRLFSVTPLAFGEGNPTGRVRNLAKWKRPAFWVTTLCMVLCIVLAVCLLTNSTTGVTVWEWVQGIDEEDVISATPWSQDKINLEDAFLPLNDAETIELITLLNNLTKDSFTHNKHLRGGTPTYGLEIVIGSETYHLNQANGPHGTLEVSYNEKLWWIDDAELSAFVQWVTTEAPTESEQMIVDTIPKLSVSYGEEMVLTPRVGEASWEYLKADGTEGALLGDGAHPLDAKDSSPFFVLDPYAETPFEIWLIWELAPSTVMVRYWDESCWGQLEAQPVGRELLAKSGNADFAYYFEPQEGNYIYEVIATWENAPDYSGRVYYNFHCVLTDEEPTAQRIYERAQRIYEKYLENFTKVDPLYMDLNQDGEPELIIDYRNSSEMAIVTIVDGEPVIVLEGNCMFLCEDGIIGSWGEGSGGETMRYYRMEGQKAVLVDVVVSPSNELNWYHSSDPNVQLGATYRKNMDRITKEEGLKICAQYPLLDDSMSGYWSNFYVEE